MDGAIIVANCVLFQMVSPSHFTESVLKTGSGGSIPAHLCCFPQMWDRVLSW